MQFLWVYIDDLVGKGLSGFIVSKFLFFVSITLVPMALPLAILLSSLMTFGNLAEHYELVAMKSAGLSLNRIMRPLTIVSLIISITAFSFSNNILPWANLKMQSLLFDITHSKPAINIKEGIFYNGINGYSIRVEKKSQDGNLLKHIMIYDHKSVQGNNKVVFADSGKMEMPSKNNLMIIKLFNGYSYEEMLNTEKQLSTRPLVRNKFKEEIIRFDLSDFKMNKTDENLFKTNYQMLNILQLKSALDSMSKKSKEEINSAIIQLNSNHYSKSLVYLGSATNRTTDNDQNCNLDFYNSLPFIERARILESAINIARNSKVFIETSIDSKHQDDQMINRFKVELHKKFTLSFACFILFFIGAPLGAIIRKGGLGMPVVVSVIFFILFYIISVMGEKLVKEGKIEAYIGMWIAPAVLLPLGVFLTYKASTDSSIFEKGINFKRIKMLLIRN